ncbi:hypothetical protein [Muriicola marianensis]|uniref:Uncharacterized protein n=1 Tax=Muriicola marianensis TaxID=1324801 RepID=A0ABQ1R276_9FLAO|nr:hypothetical protein [Muriicola marianensis]GGD55643.1 hypothetical protein GCM10011361_22680 [Muriicola marianensis]
MERKRFIAQVGIAAILYVLISLILEKEITKEVLVRELRDGLVFGLVYAIFLWIWNRFKSRKGPENGETRT